jgi:hypothetical protein
MTATVSALTPEQMRFFEEEGYLALEGLLAEADLQPVIEEIDAEVNYRRPMRSTASNGNSPTSAERPIRWRAPSGTARWPVPPSSI